MSGNDKLKVMYLNPVGTADYDDVFADMAREHKLPNTEVHITSLNRVTERLRTSSSGVMKRLSRPGSSGRPGRRRVRGSMRLRSGAFTTRRCMKPAKCRNPWWLPHHAPRRLKSPPACQTDLASSWEGASGLIK